MLLYTKLGNILSKLIIKSSMSDKNQTKTSSYLSTGVTTTVSITLVLFLLGLTIFVTFMGRQVSSFIKENLSITIEVADNADQASITKLEKRLSESSYVKSYNYIGKEDVKKELIEELGSDPEELLGYIPASSFFDVYLKSDYADAHSISKIQQDLKGHTVIKSFIYNEDTLHLVNSNLKKIATGSIIFAVILMFISFTLIRNTIRLNIYSKRFIINTMQLVGATNAFIRKPFLKQATMFGILAAIFANIGLTALIYFLSKDFPEILSIIKPSSLVILYIIIIILGIVITLFATASAVNKYLKTNTNKLYYL